LRCATGQGSVNGEDGEEGDQIPVTFPVIENTPLFTW
jgi:hypothetical protein